MLNFLIFRTDRIGDFLLTAILVNSIKRNNPKTNINIVASQKNYKYIRTFSNIDNVLVLKNTFFEKLKFILKYKNNKYDYIIVHDNKKRSLFVSKFLNSKSILFLKNDKNMKHIDQIKCILHELNFNFSENDLSTLENRCNQIKNLPIDYIVFHFDEKWFNKLYIKDYTDIEPTEKKLIDFLNSLYFKTQKKIVITTGENCPTLLDNIDKILDNKKFLLFKKLDFYSLESIVSKCQLLIACHGAISHISAAKNIRQIDIIEKSKSEFYKLWTSHFRNYYHINRKKFDLLSKEILELI